MARQKISALRSPYYSNAIGGVSFTVNAKSGSTITVNLQFKDTSNNNLAQRGWVGFFIADDAAGDTLTGTAPTTVAAGANGWVQNGANTKFSHALTEANGTLDIAVTYAGTKNWYIGVQLPDGSVVMSPVLAF